MATQLTKMIVDNDNAYNLYYQDYDDNGTLTDQGNDFFSEFSDDIEISSNDGVYEDSLGVYTKDSDGNKVYHNYEKNLNSVELDFTQNHLIVITFNDDDNTVLSLDLYNDFDKNGVYEDDGDDYYLKVDLVAKTYNFKPKKDYGIANVKFPNSIKLMKMLNKDYSFEYTYNNIHKVNTDYYDQTKEDLENKYNYLVQLDNTNTITLVDLNNKNYNDLVTLNNNNKDSIIKVNNDNKDELVSLNNDNKDKISNELTDKLTTTNDNINTKAKDIQDSISCAKSNLISINGNAGSKYSVDQIVDVIDYNGRWRIDSMYVFKNDKRIISIIYLLTGIDDVNKDRQFLCDEAIIKGLAS